jgi:hypothetical protein
MLFIRRTHARCHESPLARSGWRAIGIAWRSRARCRRRRRRRRRGGAGRRRRTDRRRGARARCGRRDRCWNRCRYGRRHGSRRCGSHNDRWRAADRANPGRWLQRRAGRRHRGPAPLTAGGGRSVWCTGGRGRWRAIAPEDLFSRAGRPAGGGSRGGWTDQRPARGNPDDCGKQDHGRARAHLQQPQWPVRRT